MIFAAFEQFIFARGLRVLPLYQCDFKAISQIFMNISNKSHDLSRTKIMLAFEKIFSCLFIPNCTRNHVITCTNYYLSCLQTEKR